MTVRRSRIAQIIKEFLSEGQLPAEEITATGEELKAVEYAFDELQCADECAFEKVNFAILHFSKGCTMTEAADLCFISERTAYRWKEQVIDLVNRELLN